MRKASGGGFSRALACRCSLILARSASAREVASDSSAADRSRASASACACSARMSAAMRDAVSFSAASCAPVRASESRALLAPRKSKGEKRTRRTRFNGKSSIQRKPRGGEIKKTSVGQAGLDETTQGSNASDCTKGSDFGPRAPLKLPQSELLKPSEAVSVAFNLEQARR